MARLSVTKGKTNERRIAAILRERFPGATVRRASQADRPVQSDVYITGGPPLLARLWLECQSARRPTPIAKLEQAELDCASQWGAFCRLPVAITHRLGERTTYVTTRLWVLDSVRGQLQAMSDVVVSMEFGEFLDVVEQHAKREVA